MLEEAAKTAGLGEGRTTCCEGTDATCDIPGYPQVAANEDSVRHR